MPRWRSCKRRKVVVRSWRALRQISSRGTRNSQGLLLCLAGHGRSQTIRTHHELLACALWRESEGVVGAWLAHTNGFSYSRGVGLGHHAHQRQGPELHLISGQANDVQARRLLAVQDADRVHLSLQQLGLQTGKLRVPTKCTGNWMQLMSEGKLGCELVV